MTVARVLERASAVASIAAALPDLEHELADMEEKALQIAFTELRTNTLRPEVAHSTLMQVFSYRELARKLRRRTAAEGGTA